MLRFIHLVNELYYQSLNTSDCSCLAIGYVSCCLLLLLLLLPLLSLLSWYSLICSCFYYCCCKCCVVEFLVSLSPHFNICRRPNTLSSHHHHHHHRHPCWRQFILSFIIYSYLTTFNISLAYGDIIMNSIILVLINIGLVQHQHQHQSSILIKESSLSSTIPSPTIPFTSLSFSQKKTTINRSISHTVSSSTTCLLLLLFP